MSFGDEENMMRRLRDLLLRSCLKAAMCLKALESARVDQLVSRLFQVWYDMPFPPVHYYSPLPDIRSVKRNLPRWYKEDISPGIDWNVQEQLELAKHIVPYACETNSLPPFSRVTEDGYGPGYGEIEAHLLYMILRYLKPSKVVEVGSGVSTFYTLTALRTNRARENVESNMTCVEPYPNDKLHALVSEHSVHLQECEVQNIDCATFQELSANDVLFIDSSHVSKKDSDVEFLFLEVLPRLHKGVVIHIHDIPLPMPAPPVEHPMFDTFLFWNESALVRAFLMFNTAFRVIMCQSYLHHVRPEVLKTLVPIYNPQLHFPSSLWMQKVV
jgi:predicted O-methyltransferase YrrM